MGGAARFDCFWSCLLQMFSCTLAARWGVPAIAITSRFRFRFMFRFGLRWGPSRKSPYSWRCAIINIRASVISRPLPITRQHCWHAFNHLHRFRIDLFNSLLRTQTRHNFRLPNRTDSMGITTAFFSHGPKSVWMAQRQRDQFNVPIKNMSKIYRRATIDQGSDLPWNRLHSRTFCRSVIDPVYVIIAGILAPFKWAKGRGFLFKLSITL